MSAQERDGAWGFIGLGEMGEPMVANLVSHGLDVVVFDRDAARTRRGQALGASAAPSVAAVAEASSTVSICVRDAEQVNEVVEGGLAAAAPGMTVLIHSTIGPEPCRRVARRLAESAVRVLDAPISGMRMAAAAGTLTLFVGGPADVLERVRPGLDAMAAKILHVGDVGAGQLVKIANNVVAFATAGLLHEAVEIARAAGVEEQRLLTSLSSGSARSWVVENWRFLRHEWPASQPGGAHAVHEIVTKDLQLGVRTAAELGIDAPFAGLAAELVPALLGQPAPSQRQE